MQKTMTEVKVEAIRRMEAYHLGDVPIRMFEKEDTVCMSEPPLGILHAMDGTTARLVAEVERQYNLTVYHVIRSIEPFGECLSLLYVYHDDEDWIVDSSLERDFKASGILKSGPVYAYVINKTVPECSEFGMITVAKGDLPDTGLVRIG